MDSEELLEQLADIHLPIDISYGHQPQAGGFWDYFAWRQLFTSPGTTYSVDIYKRSVKQL